jgi:hypothetical protein
MTKCKPKSLKAQSISPGLAKLNNAGIAINKENNGIKTQVRLRKNPKLILET